MADVSENEQFTDPALAISQGKRHLLVRDYGMAVAALTQACELLAEKHGDSADELGEPYLLYGRALLNLAREEAGVLGTGVPGNEENEGEDGEDEEDGKANNEEADDKTENDDEKSDKNEAEEGEKPESEDQKTPEDTKEEESKPETSESTSSKTETDQNEMPGTSKGDVITNGKSSDGQENGVSGEENEDEESDDVGKEDDEEDDIHNLQVAWEVLELAKLVLLKRGPPGWKHLAEAHRLLGEVAMEGGNHQGALKDLKACLDLLKRVEPSDPRTIAETHYQLGVAHSLGNEFDESIEQFNQATILLEARIKELEAMPEPPKSDDPFYTVEGEIKELKSLLPEIQEKIADMKDFKQEACKAVLEEIKNKVGEGSCSNGAGPSGETSGSSTSSTSAASSKPASDISHLVRKKRKADEQNEAMSPAKKPNV